MKLYIIRHGETDWNKLKKVQGHADIPLNEYGRSLARQTAEGMKDIPLDLAYTSPLQRARETAEILLCGRNIPLLVEEDIKEINFGSYEGMCCGGDQWDSRREEFNRFFTDTSNYAAPKDGETIQMLFDRTGRFLERLARDKTLENKNVLVSTHGAAMTAMVNRMKGNLVPEDFWRDKVPSNCAVTMARLVGDRFVVEKEGMVFHREQVKSWQISPPPQSGSCKSGVFSPSHRSPDTRRKS